MGCDWNSVCHDCLVWQSNGYGSYGSWITGVATVEEFDAKAVKHPHDAEMGKNRNIRHFLVQHQGHQVAQVCGDSFSWDDEDSPRWRYEEVDHKYHFGCECYGAVADNVRNDIEDVLAANPNATEEEVVELVVKEGNWTSRSYPAQIVREVFAAQEG